MRRLGYLGFCTLLGFGVAVTSCSDNTSSKPSPGGTGGSTSTTGKGGSGGGSTTTTGNGGTTGGGGQTAKTFESLVPRDNEISGWKIDPENDKTAGRVAAIATTKQAGVDLVDGSAEDFWFKQTPKTFAWQNYLNASLASSLERPGVGSTLELYMFEMPSEAEAAGLYKTLIDEGWALWKQDWTEPTSPAIGTKARLSNSGATWWVNFYKGIYYVEAKLTPSYGPESAGFPEKDPAQKKAVLDFCTALAAKF